MSSQGRMDQRRDRMTNRGQFIGPTSKNSGSKYNHLCESLIFSAVHIDRGQKSIGLHFKANQTDHFDM